ncbi:MAG: energy-coupling factor transporter transmembrane protein EcfT [Mycoplasma sp.]|nr:energy-coupling factor transporter transmembrane protein EcfT [Candidatus Hennigella equi]
MYTFTTPLEERPLFLNKFNPTLKVICAILLLALTFIPVPAILQIGFLALVICLWISARLPKKKLKPITRTLLVLFFFIFLINWLVSKNPGLKIDLESHYHLWGSDWLSILDKGWISKYGDYYWTHGTIWGGWVDNKLLTEAPTVGSYVRVIINGTKYYLAYSSPWYGLSSQVLITSVSVCIKLFCMLAIFSLLVNTTSTLQLTYAFEHILWPLKWIKVPVTEISYIIAVAIRFVPDLFAEANKIISAQASRGMDFRNGRLVTKIKAVGSLVVPMFATSFNHADKLSDAMEARNFVPRAKRTKYRHFPCSASNWVSFAILICLLALFIYLRVCKVIISPFIAIDCFNI